jgi:hypothetical protein
MLVRRLKTNSALIFTIFSNVFRETRGEAFDFPPIW